MTPGLHTGRICDTSRHAWDRLQVSASLQSAGRQFCRRVIFEDLEGNAS